jgi:hypothetical protein
MVVAGLPWLAAGALADTPPSCCPDGPYGDGSDGTAVITANTVLSHNMNYEDLTIQSGVTLDVRGHVVRVCGTLLNYGTITDTYGGGPGGAGGAHGWGGDPNDSPPGSTKPEWPTAGECSCTIGQPPVLPKGGRGGDGGGGGGGGGGADNTVGVDADGGNGGNGGAGGRGGGYVCIYAFNLDNRGTIHADGASGSAGQSGEDGEYYPWPLRDMAGGGGGGGGGGAGGNGGAVEVRYGVLLNQGTVRANGGAGGAGGTGGDGHSLAHGALICHPEAGVPGCSRGGWGGDAACQGGESSEDGQNGTTGPSGSPGTVSVSVLPFLCQGACCLPGGTCQVLSPTSCDSQDGTYEGSGTICSAGVCSLWAPMCDDQTSQFGSGADGDVVLDDSLQLTQDKNYQSLTIRTGVTLDLRGHVLRVCGTLMNWGVITDSYGGGDGGDGGLPGYGGDWTDSPEGNPKPDWPTPGSCGGYGDLPTLAGGGRGGDGGGGGGGGGSAKNLLGADADGGNYPDTCEGAGGAGGRGGGYVRICVFNLNNRGIIHADGSPGGRGYWGENGEYFALPWGAYDLAGGGGGGGAGGNGGSGGTVEIHRANLITQGIIRANGGAGGGGGTGGSGFTCLYGSDGCFRQDGVPGACGGGCGGNGECRQGYSSTGGQNGATGTAGSSGTVSTTVVPIEREGACCLATGCETLTAAECAAAAGTYYGGGTSCERDDPCPPDGCCRLPEFGDGSDGDVVISSNTTLSRDMDYANVIVASGVTLDVHGHLVRVCDRLLNFGTITDTLCGSSGGPGGDGGWGGDPNDSPAGNPKPDEPTPGDCGLPAAVPPCGGQGGHGGGGGGGGGGANNASLADADGGNAGGGGDGGRGGGSVNLSVYFLNNQGVIHADGSPGLAGSRGQDGEYFHNRDTSFIEYDLAGGGGGGGGGGDGGNGGAVTITYAYLVDEGAIRAAGGAGGAGGVGGLGHSCDYGSIICGTQPGAQGCDNGGDGGASECSLGAASQDGAGGAPGQAGVDGTVILIPAPPRGACCLPYLGCWVMPEEDCMMQGGQFMGKCTSCSPVDPCLGACCHGVYCTLDSEDGCSSSGGRFVGVDVSCDPNPCRVRGDLNCDGVVNGYDIDPFVLALTDPEEYYRLYPECDHMLADINCDGLVNGYDIDPFVECLTHGSCPPCP